MRRYSKKLDYGALLPGVGVFGGVRRFIEIGNELVRRGHRFVLYHPGGEPPEWLRFEGEVAPVGHLKDAHHHVLICNDPPMLPYFESARSDVKFFYVVLEKLKNEKSIVTSRKWTVLANSTNIYDRLRRRYRVKAEKVVGGINLGVFRPDPERFGHSLFEEHEIRRGSGRLRILAYGRASRRTKGVPLIVKAVEDFHRTMAGGTGIEGIELVLFDHVGPGNEGDPRDQVKISIPHEYHINLTQAELANLYTTCDLFLSAERRAGWSNTVAEAMACGVPVVCTPSGTKDMAIHKETAWVVRWRHPFFLKRGLMSLSVNRDLRNRIRRNALERIQAYDWPSVVDQLERAVQVQFAERSLHGA